MSEPGIERWRQAGGISLWRYPDTSRNYPGWDCLADTEGCHSIAELLAMMLAARWTATANIKLFQPTESTIALPGDYGGKAWISAVRLCLRYPTGKVAENLWHWSGQAEAPTLTVGKSKLDELARAFNSMALGRGDLCIHADNARLHGIDSEKLAIWFW
jgi:hypothetical protein